MRRATYTPNCKEYCGALSVSPDCRPPPFLATNYRTDDRRSRPPIRRPTCASLLPYAAKGLSPATALPVASSFAALCNGSTGHRSGASEAVRCRDTHSLDSPPRFGVPRAHRDQMLPFDMSVRRWWAHTWAPSTLVLAAAIILWLLGAGPTDTGAIILMVFVLVMVGASLESAQKTWRPPPPGRPRNWRH